MFDIKRMKVCARCYHNLEISLDYDEDPKEQHAVLLFTPNMNNTSDHYHIALNWGQMRALHDWLASRLIDTTLAPKVVADEI